MLRLRPVRTSKLIPLILLAACGGPKKSTDPVPAPAPAPAPSPGPEQSPAPTPPAGASSAALVEEAKKFVADNDKELRKLYVDSAVADWANQTDITPEHEAAAAKASEQMANGITRLIPRRSATKGSSPTVRMWGRPQPMRGDLLGQLEVRNAPRAQCGCSWIEPGWP